VPPSYRFLRSRKWIVLSLILVFSVVLMINLGFWQLRRLDEKRTRNDEIRDRSTEPTVALADLVDPDDPTSVGGDLRFRAVQATGTYDLADQFLLRSRDLEGQPGFWVYTPLDLGDGTAVAVNRGWIPAGVETDGSDVDFPTPSGPVTVYGLVEPSFSDPRPSGERQTTVAHADMNWFDDRIEANAYPVAIQLQEQDPPPTGDLPVVLPPPALDEGPHLSYAIQWFLFTAVALIGFPILIVRTARQQEDDGDDDGEGSDDVLGHSVEAVS
jgi:cytochrome oxidase assembly protein ShyY1